MTDLIPIVIQLLMDLVAIGCYLELSKAAVK